jgi:predicted acyl esterase
MRLDGGSKRAAYGCRYRDGRKKPAMMVPGKACRIRMEGFPVSKLFKPAFRREPEGTERRRAWRRI